MSGLLSNRTYLHLFAAQVVALTGTGILTVALGLLAFDIAGSRAGVVLGWALTVRILVYAFGSPVITALVRRLPVTAVLVSADLVRVAVALSLPLITTEAQLYLAVFVIQAASACFTPTFQALIPRVVTDERDYTKALSLSRLAYDLEQVISPSVAAVLLTFMSYHNLFAATAVGFALSALFVLTAAVGTAAPEKPTDESFLTRLSSGFSTMLRTPALRAVVGFNMAVAAPMAFVLVDSIVLVKAGIGFDDHFLAIALGAFGAGSIVLALALPRLVDKVGEKAVMAAGAVGSSLVLASCALALPWLVDPTHPAVAYSVLCLMWFWAGAGICAVHTPLGKLLRANADDEHLPGLFAAQFSLSHACYLVTYPVAGWVGNRLGLSAAAWILCLVTFAATGWALTQLIASSREGADRARSEPAAAHL
ncbi:MFS transporter [Corynebacterium mendelii]|uniref:MFS transporter n=1 Tax=Corynebacterium mendelii TaxID=2765362 RepID=A0A939E0L4_9CORY|nr:MFS transporter [Corynebacterium mendelii]MBN9644249.1 MFS transporter [Corynebacterium mendelii]